MSEKLNHLHESGPSASETEPTVENPTEHHEKPAEETHAEHANRHHQAEQAARHHAISRERHLGILESTERQRPPDNMYVNHELKSMSLQRSLRNIRRRLNAPEKVLSKLMHQPLVDKTSEVAARTIARPAGILGGALTAFIGTSVLLWTAKHYGYKYNLTFFFLLFVAGFLVGSLIELAWRLSHRSRS